VRRNQKGGKAIGGAKKCPKFGREMFKGSNENLVRNSACTRAEPEPEDSQIVEVQSCHCRNCGYMEFYKEREGAKPRNYRVLQKE